ncbi:MAG: hypothetical protein MUF19_00265 [Candidatus Pacebacteria bacterium]|jgi:hypothetical protein|nr:hypothetical protein [Candidatus Paceibacterota bacterium]
MEVPRQGWHIVTLTVYSAVVAFAALLFSWPVPFSLFLLCGVPLLLLVYEFELPLARLLAAVAVLSVVVLILDAVAHTTGSWYTVVGSPWRLLGVTFESALFAIVHTLYFLVLYEFMFDDTKVRALSRRRLVPAAALLVTLLVSSFYLFSVWTVSFAFSWILGLLFIVLLGLMWLAHPGDSTALLQKSVFFGVFMLPLSLMFELIALDGGVRVFAFSSEYLATVTLLGQSVPVEELVLLVVWPALLVFMYECFIDNGI